jgi:hypothetical protein
MVGCCGSFLVKRFIHRYLLNIKLFSAPPFQTDVHINLTPFGQRWLLAPDGACICSNLRKKMLSPTTGYTRDAAIRPNKLDRLRAEFWLFSLVLPLLLIESPFQPRLQPGMRLEITGSVRLGKSRRYTEDLDGTFSPERRSNELVSGRIIERCWDLTRLRGFEGYIDRKSFKINASA